MKKLLALLLALTLLLLPAAASAEEAADPAAELAGDWFGELGGMVLKLSLNEDGSYAASFAARPDGAVNGTWTLEDGFVFLDGEAAPEICVWGPDSLEWTSFAVFLRREAPAVYTPAEPLADAAKELCAGCWRALYAGVDGAVLPAENIGCDTVLYVEGTDVALAGDFLGDTVLTASFADGALTWEGEGTALELRLQKDGFLRMTYTADGQSIDIWLLPFYIEGLSPAIEQAEAPA